MAHNDDVDWKDNQRWIRRVVDQARNTAQTYPDGNLSAFMSRVNRSMGNTKDIDIHYAEWLVRTMLQSGDLQGKFEDTSEAQWTNITFDGATGNLKEAIKKLNEQSKQNLGRANAAELRVSELETELKAAKKAHPGIMEVRVKKEGKKDHVVKGMFHGVFPKVVSLAQARENIYLYGPTGCGKTFLCEQLAETLQLPYSFISCTTGMSEGRLEGRLLPTGKGGAFEYIPAEYVERYENGGVFLLDEYDAADANVLLLLNTSLSGKMMAVPNRRSKPYAKRHPDFVMVVAANTIGTGADRLYSGRNKQDDAGLDRFRIGKVFMDYDEKLEEKLCPDEILRARLLAYRKGIRENRLERSLSTRFLEKAHKMKSSGAFTDTDVDEALFLGWREDEINKTKQYFSKSA